MIQVWCQEKSYCPPITYGSMAALHVSPVYNIAFLIIVIFKSTANYNWLFYFRGSGIKTLPRGNVGVDFLSVEKTLS